MPDDRPYRFARSLRRSSTPQEARLWARLRNRGLAGLKLHRQHPLLGYIADFYCAERGLVVELDGAVHLEAEQTGYDEHRNAWMQARDLTVLRLANDELEADFNSALVRIRDTALALPIFRGHRRQRRGKD